MVANRVTKIVGSKIVQIQQHTDAFVAKSLAEHLVK